MSEAVRNKLDVLSRQLGIHTDQPRRKGIYHIQLASNATVVINMYSPVKSSSSITTHSTTMWTTVRMWMPLEMAEQQACGVSVESLVATGEFVGEGESRYKHKARLLRPEN